MITTAWRWIKKSTRRLGLNSNANRMTLLLTAIAFTGSFIAVRLGLLKILWSIPPITYIWLWITEYTQETIAIAAIAGATISAWIGYKSIKISAQGPPILEVVNIRKNKGIDPFVVMVTNGGKKNFLPLQVILEIRNLTGRPIHFEKTEFDTKSPYKARFKFSDFEDKHRDEVTENFRILPSGSRYSYRLEWTPDKLIHMAKKEKRFPDQVEFIRWEKRIWDEMYKGLFDISGNNFSFNIGEIIRCCIENYLRQHRNPHFRFYGGVEVPSKHTPYRVSKEFIEIKFDENTGLMCTRPYYSEENGSDDQLNWKPDQYYGFKLIDNPADISKRNIKLLTKKEIQEEL